MAKEEQNAFTNVLSFFSQFQFKLPFFNQESRKEESKVTENRKAVVVPRAGGGDSGGDEKLAAKPNLARFPTSNGSVNPTPLEFEAEQPSGRTSNPVVLWQVRFSVIFLFGF